MDRKRNIVAVILPLALALGLVAGVFIGRYVTFSPLSPAEKKLHDMLSIIRNEYVDVLDVDSLLESAFPVILESLDPHSTYIPASELQEVNDQLGSSFSGVGVSFQIIGDTVRVMEVVPGGPAERVGIQVGDRIISAGKAGLTGSEVTSDSVFHTLRGPKGSVVRLKIVRSSSPKPLEFEVVRDEIPVNSIDCVYKVEDGIGYVRVSKFARTTYDEFVEALEKLKEAGVKKFVVDLRGNTGGFMDQAIFMANEFLPEGKLIVYSKGRVRANETVAVSDGSGSFLDSELVVLTDEISASASEIFAGAIQDNDRGLVVGRRSFGKGLVQNQTEFKDNSAMRLTVARYFTPSGRSIQKPYTLGSAGRYDMDIADRFSHGEMFHADSIRLDKSKMFTTPNGRTVYGGGGIMPDVFVPEDTVGITSYYINVANKGLLQKFALGVADKYKAMLDGVKTLPRLMKVLPRDNTLLDNFVNFAADNGVPARWYYINQSRDLLLRQIKAFIARDVLGIQACIEVLNEGDPTVSEALLRLRNGESPVNIMSPTDASPKTDGKNVRIK